MSFIRRSWGSLVQDASPGVFALYYFGIVVIAIVLLIADIKHPALAFLDTSDKLASVIAAFVALIGMFFVYIQLRMQAYSSDVQAIYLVHADINAALYKLEFEYNKNIANNDEAEKRWDYFFRELLTAYESACYCYNHDMLQAKAKALLAEFLVDGLRRIYEDENLRREAENIKKDNRKAMREAEHFLKMAGVQIKSVSPETLIP